MVGAGLRGVAGASLLLRVLSVLPELLQVEGQPGYTGGVVGRKGRVGEATTPAVKRAQVYERTHTHTRTHARFHAAQAPVRMLRVCMCSRSISSAALPAHMCRQAPDLQAHAMRGRARDLAWAQAAGMIVLGFGNVSEACMWLEVRRLRQCATVQPRTVPSSVGCQRCCLQWQRGGPWHTRAVRCIARCARKKGINGNGCLRS